MTVPITRPYQAAAVEAIEAKWLEGSPSTLAVLATGTGKTWLAARLLVRRRDAGYGRSLWLAHRIELVQQAAEALRAAGLTVDVESGDSLAMVRPSLLGCVSDAVVATVQSLRGRRLERWPADAFRGAIVIDEAHHATADQYRGVLERFPLARVVGITATPDRGDGVGLAGVFATHAYSYEMREAIRDGYLCPIRCKSLDAPTLDLDSVRVTKQAHGRDYHATDLSDQLETPESLLALATQIVEAAGSRATLIFTPSVKGAYKLAEVIGQMVTTGSQALDGESETGHRTKTVDDFRSGRLQFLSSMALLTEGFDAPIASCVVLLRASKSRSLVAQMIGRGTRLHPGKEDLLVLDLATNLDQHSLATPLDVLAGKPIRDDVRRLAQSAIADGEALSVALENAEETAKKREELRQLRRAKKLRTRIKATATWQEREVDPFRDLRDDRGRRREPSREERAKVSLERLVERLVELGVAVPKGATREQCDRWMDSIARREALGICTIKQARSLRKHGLRTDLTKAEAKECFSVLVRCDWHCPDSLKAKYGA